MGKAERLIALVQEIEARPGQTAESLASKFDCSARTIQRDIQRLPELGVVVVNEDGYRFLNKPYLKPLALTHEEVVSMTLAHRVAQPHLDERASKTLQGVVDKIRHGLATTDRITADKLEHRTAVNPSAETETDTSGALFGELTEAVSRQRQIFFDYQGRDDKACEERWAEPLGLFFQEKRWYLHAYDLNREGIRTFRLGRMSNLRVTSVRFEPKDTFSSEKASFHQWDIAEGEPVTLKFNLSSGLARWFEENKPHPTVQVDGTCASITVSDPDAFLRWFTSLDDAELVAPNHFRERLRARLQRLHSLYDY